MRGCCFLEFPCHEEDGYFLQMPPSVLIRLRSHYLQLRCCTLQEGWLLELKTPSSGPEVPGLAVLACSAKALQKTRNLSVLEVCEVSWETPILPGQRRDAALAGKLMFAAGVGLQTRMSLCSAREVLSFFLFFFLLP